VTAFEGERVLWVGQPARVRVLDRVGRAWLVFAVFYGVVCATSVAYALLSGNVNSLPLTVLFTVCVVVLVVAAFAQLHANRRTARYVVTDRRVVATSKWFGQDRVRSVALGDLGAPAVSTTDSSVGTIRFGHTPVIEALNKAVSSWGQNVPLVFWDVEDAERVHDIIVTAQGGSR
jgi:hypothetical protein